MSFFVRLLIVFNCFPVLVFSQVTPLELSSEVQKRVSSVPEFEFIIQEAEKLGVKVYLFGGTASAFAHYVRWDLERKKGDIKHQAERFDYDFTNIYRGNQDLDIVVDGTPAEAEKLKATLQKRYPHFIGAKEDWEVRLLREQIGDKSPLLNDPDFQKQHTDSNSTGLLDLTAEEEAFVFRDLHDWENKESLFLKDVASAKITYLFSKNHSETTRFKEGKNPPIFSALRYLAKLTQYEVTGTQNDLAIIQKIINGTDFKSLSHYVKKKLSEFALKTLLNAPDVEYAWNLLEELGLRKKLIEMDLGQINKQDTLSWWLNKEPLRSKKLGTEGKRAAEIAKGLGLEEIILSHETRSFVAYENITRSSRGKANAFISRQGVAGEAAVLGDGFYARLGKEGAVGSGLTIRFRLHPDAREGEDFTFDGEFFVIKNKNALTLIQENINIGMIDFLKLFVSNKVNYTDQGLIEKLLRKYDRQGTDSAEFTETIEYIKNEFDLAEIFQEEEVYLPSVERVKSFRDLFTVYVEIGTSFFKEMVVKKLSEEPPEFWLQRPHMVEKLVSSGRIDSEIVFKVLSKKGWEKRPDLVEEIINRGTADNDVLTYLLSQDHWQHQTKWIEHFLDKGLHDKVFAEHILSQPFSKNHPEWLEKILERKSADYEIVSQVLTKEHWKHREDIIEKFIREKRLESHMIIHLFSKKHWSHRTDWVEYYLDLETSHALIAEHILSKPWAKKEWAQKIIKSGKAVDEILQKALPYEHWKDYPEFIEYYLNKNDEFIDQEIVRNILTKDHWAHREDWIETLLERKDVNFLIIDPILKMERWKHKEEWVQKIIDAGDDMGADDVRLVILIAEREHWFHREDWIETLVARGAADWALASFIFSNEQWKHRVDLVEKLMERDSVPGYIISNVLSQEHFFDEKLINFYLERDKDYLLVPNVFSHEYWVNHPEIIENLIQRGKSDDQLIQHVLSKKHWKHKPEWVENMLQKESQVLDWLLISRVLSQSHWKHKYEWVREIIKRDGDSRIISLIHQVLSKEPREEYVTFIDEIITRWKYNRDVVLRILSQKHWKSNLVAWSRIILKQIKETQDTATLNNFIDFVLKEKFTAEFPEIYVELVLAHPMYRYDKLESYDHWIKHPLLQDYLGVARDALVRPADIRMRNEVLNFAKWYKSRSTSVPKSFSCHAVLN